MIRSRYDKNCKFFSRMKVPKKIMAASSSKHSNKVLLAKIVLNGFKKNIVLDFLAIETLIIVA
jgi:hypothetical protein